ncbi:unnamed protein product [Ambrosiozyma monospora]|uniref:Unnamed protein product n=1 Tax=Ambrosiozyma monospora TaxID=43982 RepID=A0A9W7DEW6_AMBMO|nr:unnamed protein product [Ambrosiozyma monospora]
MRLNPLVPLLLFVSQSIVQVAATDVIFQLQEKTNIEQFKTKYEEFITQHNAKIPLDNDNLPQTSTKDNDDKDTTTQQPSQQELIRCLEMGKTKNFKACVVSLSTELLKTAFFDNTIKRISLDRPVQLCTTQEFAPKHLVRLSQLHRILKRQTMEFQYENGPVNASMGFSSPVKVYLLDSGINHAHLDFEARVKQGLDLVNDGFTGDPNGHGTAVAGVVGSGVFGVDKSVEIVDYRVFDFNGETIVSGIIDALSEIITHEEPGVVLMPFVTENNKILNSALKQVKSAGFALVAAAGNFGQDACLFSPASSKDVITVGAIDPYTDEVPSFSNWGKCVNVFSDGVNVATLSNDDNEFVTIKSGTSLAAAQGAALIATFLSLNDTVDEAIERMKDLAVGGAISQASIVDKPGTTNKILYNYNGQVGLNLLN